MIIGRISGIRPAGYPAGYPAFFAIRYPADYHEKQEQTPYETQLRSSVGQKAHIFFRLSLLQLEYCKMLICLRILLSWIW